VVHVTGGGLLGLGLATAVGLMLAGIVVAIAFRRSMKALEAAT
jgi:hypothetical protein